MSEIDSTPSGEHAPSPGTLPPPPQAPWPGDPGAGWNPPPPGWTPPGPPFGVRLRRRRWPFVLLAVVVVLAGAVYGLDHWSVNYYAITPGQAQSVAPLIDVPTSLDHKLSGDVLLTDVYLTQLNALTYLQERYLSSDAQVYPSGEILGTGVSENEYIAQGYLDMSQAQQFAKAAALSHLGYSVHAKNVGALVYGIEAGSPASRILQVGQIILGVDYTLTPDSCALIGALHGLAPGTVADVKVEKSTINDIGEFEPGPVVTEKITLATPPKGLVDQGCGAPSRPTAILGISTEDQQSWTFPVKVTVHTADIGGPSAGLAMTLGIIDKLSGGHLTAGRIVAATGTIDAAGDVGDVGGVAEKTIAVERAGATVFFVPPQELAAARSKDTPQLKIYAVSTLDQALKILVRMGGKIGTAGTDHLPTQAAP
ncbi:MAG TPA: S16 family serine protease [Acidimicrobiales bacterium]|nr:S16 family serine protease [Acidimicrobiales bacterium]